MHWILQLAGYCLAIMAIGLIYFYIIEPIMLKHNVAVSSVSGVDYVERARTSGPSVPSAATGLRTDGKIATLPQLTSSQTLDICKLLRAAGVTREVTREVLRIAGGALANDVWTQAAPAEPTPAPVADDVLITPYAGRQTLQRYYADAPDLEYRAPLV